MTGSGEEQGRLGGVQGVDGVVERDVRDEVDTVPIVLVGDDTESMEAPVDEWLPEISQETTGGWDPVERAVGRALGWPDEQGDGRGATRETVGGTLEDSTLAELRKTFATAMEDEGEALESTLPETNPEVTSPVSRAEAVDPLLLTGLRLEYVGVEVGEERTVWSGEGLGELPEVGGEGAPGKWVLSLDGHDVGVELSGFWGRFAAEMFLEAVEEPDPTLRASYLLLLARVVKLCGAGGEDISARVLGVACEVSARPVLVDRLVDAWGDEPERFFERLASLEAHDTVRGDASAGARRVSIAVEYGLAVAGRRPEALSRVMEGTRRPETVRGLVFRASHALRQGQSSAAARAFYRASRHVKGEARATMQVVAAMLYRGKPELFRYVIERAKEGMGSTGLVLVMLREASRVGDRLKEAVALRYLVEADVAIGRSREARGLPESERLKGVAAARFFRLSTLLSGLGDEVEGVEQLAGLDRGSALRDAVALSPQNPLYLRRLARWARAEGDDALAAKAAASMCGAYRSGELRALAYTELARMIHLAGGERDLVVRHLSNALEEDPGCVRALVALALVQVSSGDEAGYRALLQEVDGEHLGIVFDASLREVLGRGDFLAASSSLEEELDEVVEPRAWATKTYLVAQICGWYLEPEDDAKARGEWLKQVVDGSPDHLSALVEWVEVGVASQHFDEVVEGLGRLLESIEDPEDRASWKLELAELNERVLLVSERAALMYSEVCRESLRSADALFGLLRCDAETPSAGVEGIERMLDQGVDVREGDLLAAELLVRAAESSRAREVLEVRFPQMAAYHLWRVCEGLDVASGHIAALRGIWMSRRAEPVLGVLERGLVDRAEGDGAADYREPLGISAGQEGPVVHALVRAWERGRPGELGKLAALQARRDGDSVSRAIELTWMACTLAWAGEGGRALKVAEELPARFGDYLPAVKLARWLCEERGEWARLARWAERDGQLSRVSALAVQARMRASQVQRDRLGDFEAAKHQYEEILRDDPMHEEAFEGLRPMLLQRGEVGRVVDLYERRVGETGQVEEKVEWLNAAALLALHQGEDRGRAADLFRRSLELEPAQSRPLRLLAEIYEENGRYEAAAACLRAARELTRNEELLKRMWQKIANLSERAGRPFDALEAYQHASRLDPTNASLVLELACAEHRSGDVEAALLQLRRLMSLSVSGAVQRRARVYGVQWRLEGGHADEGLLEAVDDLLVYHPEESGLAADFLSFMKKRSEADRLDFVFASATRRGLLHRGGEGFGAYYALARQAGHEDRAFRLAGLAGYFGRGTAEMEQFHRRRRQRVRWPSRALAPRDLREDVLPGAFLEVVGEVLKELEPGIRESLRAPQVARYVQEGGKLGRSGEPGLRWAMRWPRLFGFERSEFYLANHVEQGSAVLASNPVVVVVDDRWLRRQDPTELLVELGRQLTWWALGFGAWRWLPREGRALVLERVVAQVVPGWGRGGDEGTEEVLDWRVLGGWVRERMGGSLRGRCERLAGRISPRALERQFALLELGADRGACVMIDDPHRALSEAPGMTREDSLMHHPWSFLVGPRAGELRRRVGILGADEA